MPTLTAAQRTYIDAATIAAFTHPRPGAFCEIARRSALERMTRDAAITLQRDPASIDAALTRAARDIVVIDPGARRARC